jgi:hypothetical protein
MIRATRPLFGYIRVVSERTIMPKMDMTGWFVAIELDCASLILCACSGTIDGEHGGSGKETAGLAGL